MQVTSSVPTPPPWQAIGALATLLGTALTVFVTWIKERTASARRIQILDEAKRYVEFWKAYTETAAGVLGPDEIAVVSKQFTQNLRVLAEYIEYEVNQPIHQVVTDVPRSWVRRETFKERAKQLASASRSWAVITLLVFLFLWAASAYFRPSSGFLTITSDPPGTSVFLDGEAVGLTNITLKVLPGIHHIQVVKDGKIVAKSAIAIRKDDVTTFAVPTR
jgi:hypothetical protein